ncbi:MAG TPA: peptide chain release factor N(5)-glutamine methyltransferase [Thermoleophilaceae bacterium]|jgi:release factor glutamine methyltransferase|nr:peptide chain release factor N(5)-glutamine methyltransferase [Thermoleophilaceae bacterium]
MAQATPVSSVRDALSAAELSLRAAGCDTPRLDAELLLAHAMGVSREQLVMDPGGGVDPGPARRAMELIRRRVGREPVAYILGTKGFRHIDLAVDPRVLIPRPDSELLVELALTLTLPEGARVHDVGTGSGAIALALKHERPDLRVTASDASLGAVELARANAAALGLDVPVTEVSGLPPGEYDALIANLPYVREDEWAGLAPEITRFEPREALVSGADGLDAIRSLVAATPAGTLLILEHAPAQAEAVRALLRDAETHRDLAGRERVTVGRAL